LSVCQVNELTSSSTGRCGENLSVCQCGENCCTAARQLPCSFPEPTAPPASAPVTETAQWLATSSPDGPAGVATSALEPESLQAQASSVVVDVVSHKSLQIPEEVAKTTQHMRATREPHRLESSGLPSCSFPIKLTYVGFLTAHIRVCYHDTNVAMGTFVLLRCLGHKLMRCVLQVARRNVFAHILNHICYSFMVAIVISVTVTIVHLDIIPVASPLWMAVGVV